MKKEIFKCEECNKEYSTLSHLSSHVSKIHGNKKIYYDKYLKQLNEGICPECGKLTLYTDKWQNAYHKYCSEECKKKGRVKIIKETTLKKYGVTNVNKIEKIRNKISKTNKKRYDNVCPMQNKEIQNNIRQKNLKNLGVELPFQSKEIQNKSAKIRKLKYGSRYTFQSDILYNKCKNTMIERYGVPNSIQNEKIFEKQQISGLFLKKYLNINYQGSYELDFLEKYLNKFPDIKRASFIKYQYDNRYKIYFPDFYIPSLNLIIEIKNKYLAKRDKIKIKAKKIAVLKQGYQFIMIINKNYDEFEKLIKSSVI
jgi:hypothetical protein